MNQTQNPPAQNLTLPQAMQLAIKHQQTGKLQDCERLLNQILRKHPTFSPALHLMGILADQVGKGELALKLLADAIKNAPKEALFHSNRGEMCRKQGLIDEAIEHGEKAVELNPKLVQAHSNLGIAYFDKKEMDKAWDAQQEALKLDANFIPSLNNVGSLLRAKHDFEQAAEYYSKVLELQPSYIEAKNNLGAVLLETHRYEEAIDLLKNVAQVKPDYLEAHLNIGKAFERVEDRRNTMTAYREVVKLDPESQEGHMGLARVLKDAKRHSAAESEAAKVLELNPESLEGHNVMGHIQMDQGNYEIAEEWFDKTIALNEEVPMGYVSKGNLLVEVGRIDEGADVLNQAIDLDRESLQPYIALANAQKVTDDSKVFEKLSAVEVDKLPPGPAMNLNFALGKCYDDIKDADKAFPHFAAACEQKRKSVNYSADNNDLTVKNIKECFTPEFIAEHKNAGCQSDLPIFVLGMPRSGTTLTEQIIASHPTTFGAGELPDMMAVSNTEKDGKRLGYPTSMEGISDEDLTQIGEDYIERLRKHSADHSHITDKMPANFFVTGLIHLALPKAKIIHIKRNPVDTCLSNFTKNFGNSQPHTYDLTELGRFYANYAELMDHWRKVLPADAFYEIQYEDLVADTEGEAKKMLEFIGLEWDEQCLEFYKHKRSIKTASVTQVRQPVYQGSVERWRPYEQYLGPLLDELGDLVKR